MADPVSDGIENIRATARTQISRSAELTQEGARAAATNFYQSRDWGQFGEEIASMRQRTRSDGDATLDEAYSEAVRLGTDNPQGQPPILQAMNTLTPALNNAVNALNDFLSNLSGNVEIMEGSSSGEQIITTLYAPVSESLAAI